MTLLIGANLKSYSIIAADTRASWEIPFLGKQHKDGDHKIAACSFGLVTGSGYVDALDAVKKELLQKTISNTNEFTDIIQRCVKPKIEELKKINPGTEDNTCFLISYRNNEGLIRLAVMHAKWNYELELYDDVAVILPTNFTIEKSEEYRSCIREKLTEFQDNVNTNSCDNEIFLNNLINHINCTVKLIASYFHEISEKSSYVSSDVDIGVLLNDGNVIYIYGDSMKIKEGKSSLNVLINNSDTRFLTPDIIKKDEHL
ncbi:MAG: hypothetical protein PHX78_00555 [bacterium]|nr:hypothetical protein [bacterium]